MIHARLAGDSEHFTSGGGMAGSIFMDMTVATQIVKEVMDDVDEVFAERLEDVSFEAVYRKVFHLVFHKHGRMLYVALESKLQEHAQTSFCSARFHRLANMVGDLFLFMNRNFMANGDSVINMAKRIFQARAAHRRRAMEHLRRIVALVGKCALALKDHYRTTLEIIYEPGNRGYRRARDEFEAHSRELDAKRRRLA